MTKINLRLILIVLFLGVIMGSQAQQKTATGHASAEVKNVILMIGDGMGLTQVQVASMRAGFPLAMERAQYIGLAKTHSADNRVTDSAAAGTALATGTKTNNGAIGVDVNEKPLKNIREKAQEVGMATGVVVTCEITHATPAAFLAHCKSRKLMDDIASDIVTSGVDVFIGGGRNYFEKREDRRNLSDSLRDKGYAVAHSLDEVKAIRKGKVAGMVIDTKLPSILNGRDTSYLASATLEALRLLDNNAKGLFLMGEGSYIDSGGHANDADYVISETLDFDRAVRVAFDFADRNPGTLVIVTADHETGGLTIPSGNEDFLLSDKGIKFLFSTGGHTGVMVPVFAYGTGAQNFSTVMDNTDLPRKIEELTGLK
ncbi:MAG: alkaline phosphatase [Porphyromonadaceae bacterium]|nr:alkaline phosphatase [Porphyromonadaceae bacterium]